MFSEDGLEHLRFENIQVASYLKFAQKSFAEESLRDGHSTFYLRDQ